MLFFATSCEEFLTTVKSLFRMHMYVHHSRNFRNKLNLNYAHKSGAFKHPQINPTTKLALPIANVSERPLFVMNGLHFNVFSGSDLPSLNFLIDFLFVWKLQIFFPAHILFSYDRFLVA